MTNFFTRAGPGSYRRTGPLASFRENLSLLRDRLREGLADAASHAVSEAIRRIAGRLLGGEGIGRPNAFLGRAGEYATTGWSEQYDQGGWDDPWAGRHGGWDASDEEDERDVAGGSDDSRSGLPRRVLAAVCQAAGWLLRTLMSGRPLLGSLASVLLSALALLLGGGRYGCEAGLALAEAVWAVVSALTTPGTHAGDEM